MAKSHRYVGGYVNRTLEPGEVLSVPLDQRILAQSVILTSYVKGDIKLRRDIPVERIVLEDDQGNIQEIDLLPGIHTDTSSAMSRWRYRESTGQPALQAARRWRPSENAPYHECSWYAEWPLPEPLTISKIEVQSYLKKGELQIDGIAFRPDSDEDIRPAYQMALRCIPVDFQSFCNVAYDHNVFIPHDRKTYSHFQFKSLILYKDLIPLSLYPPYEESGRWNALTTCFENGKKYHIPIKPPRSLESFHVAFAAGMIRTRLKIPLADIVLVYQSGKRQVRNLLTNREGFDYLHSYRPGGSVIEGGKSGYMYDGKVSHLEIQVEEKDDPVVAIEVIDSNGDGKAGISILAMTMVKPESKKFDKEMLDRQKQTTHKLPDEFIVMDYDNSDQTFLLATRKASLFRQQPDGRREPVPGPEGIVADIAFRPQSKDYLILFEEGIVFDSRRSGVSSRVALPLGQKAVDIELNRQETSCFVLTDEGEVLTLGKDKFPKWNRKIRERFIAFDHTPSGETWIGMTQRGSFVWAGKKPKFNLPQEPKWNWDIARDMVLLDRGLILLDGFGGIHSYGNAPSYVFAGYQTHDVYVALKIDSKQQLLILDHSGTIHKVKKQ